VCVSCFILRRAGGDCKALSSATPHDIAIQAHDPGRGAEVFLLHFTHMRIFVAKGQRWASMGAHVHSFIHKMLVARV